MPDGKHEWMQKRPDTLKLFRATMEDLISGMNFLYIHRCPKY